MSKLFTIILTVSLVGFLIAGVYRFITTKRWTALIITVAIVGVATLFLNFQFGFPRIIQKRGPVEEGIAIALSYISMVLGMVAQYFYNQVKSGKKKFEFELPIFLLPILASPIVFIPLLSLVQNLPSNSGAFTTSKQMIYFVAFQNGFFWKDFLDKKQKISANSK